MRNTDSFGLSCRAGCVSHISKIFGKAPGCGFLRVLILNKQPFFIKIDDPNRLVKRCPASLVMDEDDHKISIFNHVLEALRGISRIERNIRSCGFHSAESAHE